MKVPEAHGKLATLGRGIVRCRACPRLADYLDETKRHWPEHWCRPVPGFGDPRAELALVGLAPGRHGANRTGRMFTGDHSGRWLYRALHEAGFANRPVSEAPGDGMELRNAYIASAVRCAPPGNRPLPSEIASCRPWLIREVALLPRVRVFLAIGRIGHDAILRVRGRKPSEHPFAHGREHDLGGVTLLDSYHCSRQNTNTGRLTWEMWIDVFRRARDLVRIRRST